jgi:pilus assembly protein CpaE
MIELVRHARPNDKPPRLVINQAGIPKRPEIPAKDFAETMGVEPAAIVPFDAALFGQAANNGQMLLEVQAKAPVSDSIRRLARLLTGREAAPVAEKNTPSILNFLKSRKQA